MADTRGIEAAGRAFTKGGAAFEDAFNKMNHAIAYAVYASEDNPRGNLTREEFDEYLADVRTVRKAKSDLSAALWRIMMLLEKAKPTG